MFRPYTMLDPAEILQPHTAKFDFMSEFNNGSFMDVLDHISVGHFYADSQTRSWLTSARRILLTDGEASFSLIHASKPCKGFARVPNRAQDSSTAPRTNWWTVTS